MNHIFGPYVCRRPYWWSIGSVGKGEGEQGQQRYQAEIFSRLQKYILMAAMDSPVFSFLLKLHPINKLLVHILPKWDSIVNQIFLFCQHWIGMNNMHGAVQYSQFYN